MQRKPYSPPSSNTKEETVSIADNERLAAQRLLTFITHQTNTNVPTDDISVVKKKVHVADNLPLAKMAFINGISNYAAPTQSWSITGFIRWLVRGRVNEGKQLEEALQQDGINPEVLIDKLLSTLATTKKDKVELKGTWFQGSMNTSIIRELLRKVPQYQKTDPDLHEALSAERIQNIARNFVKLAVVWKKNQVAARARQLALMSVEAPLSQSLCISNERAESSSDDVMTSTLTESDKRQLSSKISDAWMLKSGKPVESERTKAIKQEIQQLAIARKAKNEGTFKSELEAMYANRKNEDVPAVVAASSAEQKATTEVKQAAVPNPKMEKVKEAINLMGDEERAQIKSNLSAFLLNRRPAVPGGVNVFAPIQQPPIAEGASVSSHGIFAPPTPPPISAELGTEHTSTNAEGSYVKMKLD